MNRKRTLTTRRTAPVTVGLILAATLLAVGCASSPATGGRSDVYLGAGRGETLGEAVNAAKMDAVRKAVIDLIGADAEAAQAARLNEVLYSSRTPNAFVYNETMETLRRDGSLADGDLRYEIRIRVNVPAVERTLEANAITASPSGPATAPETSDPPSSPAASGASGSSAGLPLSVANVTDAERRFIERYVDTMTYMVAYPEDEPLPRWNDGEFIMESAVNQANSFLVSEGHIVVDSAQVERLKEDQRLVYEEQAGQELPLLAWIARRLNADVYLELNVRLDGRTSGNAHYATADVTINMYETSTGQIVGSVNRRSEESFSRTSQADAAVNAVQATVFQAMPFATEMAEEQMERSLARGIRYELTLQQPPDARSLSRFRNAIRDDVRSIATVSQSPAEVLLEVFFIGSTDDLVDLVFGVADRVAGFENMSLVISRGRSLTFDVGL